VGRNNDLARRAVACKAWRWRPGTLVMGNGLPWRYPDDPTEYERNVGRPFDGVDSLPDFSDAATVGALVEVVLLAHGDLDLWEVGAHPDGGAFLTIDDRTWSGEAVPDALVAALEAAP
jgi:hypothetical protein